MKYVCLCVVFSLSFQSRNARNSLSLTTPNCVQALMAVITVGKSISCICWFQSRQVSKNHRCFQSKSNQCVTLFWSCCCHALIWFAVKNFSFDLATFPLFWNVCALDTMIEQWLRFSLMRWIIAKTHTLDKKGNFFYWCRLCRLVLDTWIRAKCKCFQSWNFECHADWWIGTRAYSANHLHLHTDCTS